MKRSKYQISGRINKDVYVHYSCVSDRFLLLKENLHNLYEECFDEDLEGLPESLYDQLKENCFIVDSDLDEVAWAMNQRFAYADDTEMYQIVVNPTLDCNLSCWYCYENRIKDSKISTEVIEAIKKNIVLEFEKCKYSCLKLSFFGGEPLLQFGAIKNLLDFAKEFCEANSVQLIADFTTNATLITEDIVEYLSQFQSHFQITLDGDEEHHNVIKVDNQQGGNTYQRTIKALRLITEKIPMHYLAVRINFDNKTLNGIDRILKDIDFINRHKSFVILKKVWQLKTEDVDKQALLRAIQVVLDKGMLPDYYLMPKDSLCFAERKRQVLINYDGGVFKCTTLTSFTEDRSLGRLNLETGEITWNKDKTVDWFKDMQPQECKDCPWFPACFGSCNRQHMAHPGERLCTFDAFNLTQEEYLIYLFKYNYLLSELASK